MLLLSVEGNVARSETGRAAAAVSPDPAGVAAYYGPVGEQWTGDPAVKPYPVSSSELLLPKDGRSVVPRMGLGLMGELTYGPNGLDGFEPRLFCAMDVPLLAAAGGMGAVDTLASRLNWGGSCVGVSDALQFIDRFDGQGVLGRARMAGWVERDGQWIELAEDVAAASMGLWAEQLAAYVVFTTAHQVADGPWGSPGQVMASSERPSMALVCAGVAPPKDQADPAVVRTGDVVHTVVYDPQVLEPGEVAGRVKRGPIKVDGVSHLARRVVAIA